MTGAAGRVAAGVVATAEDSLGDWLGDEQMEGGQSRGGKPCRKP